jgi:hypothetical protein
MCAQIVFQRNGDTGKRTNGTPSGNVGVNGVGARARFVGGDQVEGMNVAITCGNSFKMCVDYRARTH